MTNTKKYAVQSAKQFPPKSILWPVAFTKTVRQRGNKKTVRSLF